MTFDRQMTSDEQVTMGGSSGEGKSTTNVYGNTEESETDIYKLEVFSKDGELLQEIPTKHFCDKMKVYGDRLFILDTMRGMMLHEYKIIQK